MRNPQVVILCGGQGTRLREETEFRPKPMVEIGGKPILWHIMKTFAHHGFTNFILCLGYKGEAIKEYFLNYEAMSSDFTIELGKRDEILFHRNHLESGWKVTLADTGLAAMTGARVKRVENYLDTEDFFLTYGDGLGDIDIRALLAFHRRHGRLATVTGVHPGSSRFGELSLEGDTVVRFAEKPPLADAIVSGGFLACRREFLQYLSSDDDCVLEREPMEKAAADRQLMVYRHPGFWQCMDTHRDRELLEALWREGRPPWKMWG